jgi:hypothetical protein
MIKIYKDSAANAIFIEDANGVQFLNSLQATNSTGVSIHDLARDIDIVTDAPFGDLVDNNGNTYGNDSTEVCNALNAIFQSSGTPTGAVPNITSSLTISLTQGETLNYELTADYGVGYEWDLSNVSGVTTVEGNIRKIIGGSSLAVGTYNIPVKAINYNGEDSETIVLTVSTPPFSNTKSVRFNQNDWLGANASLLDSVLGRSGNGSGSGDAWTISFYFKAGTSNNQNQTVFYFGSNDINNGNHLLFVYNGDNAARRQINFRYGSNNNHLTFKSPVGSVASSDGWQHIMYTYDGGTTGSSSGDINDYYSRFKLFINGVQQTTINSNGNYGNTTGLSGQNLRVGRYNSANYMRNNCKIDELAIFDSDQSGNVSSIYNSGTPFDLSTLGTQPKHWWRMGDGDTYPFLQDSGTEANCVFQMYNMTSADIVSDVP